MAEGKPEPKGEGLIKKNKKDRTEGKKGDGLETRSLAPEDRPPSQDDETRFVVTSPVMYRDDSLMQYREESDAAENFTILQPPSKPEEQPDDDQTRLIREDEDRTVIVGDENVDATILAANKTASTYVALDEGVSGRSQRGTTEAGRLLKNRFVLEEMIGSGGMGDVYKALDLRAQEARERNPYIAIKMLNENFSRHRDAFISLQRELSKTRGIPHENILAVYDFDREGETVFMSMELLDGEPLDDYLKKHTDGLPEEDAWSIIDGYCQGLIRAHGAGIVHSDFKPGNIFYTTDKTAKVFDFGIARAVSSPGDLEGSGDFTVFDAGTLGALTPTYASYEMLTGQSPAKSDDVFAAALVAYEVLTGRHPYNRVPADKALDQGLEPEPVPFLKSRHWKALRKGLELRSEERTGTIEEFYQGLFSEDPPWFRYGFIGLVVIAFMVMGFFQLTQDSELDAQLASKQLLLKTNKERIEIRLRNVTPEDFKSRAWHNDLKLELNSIQDVNRELMTDFQVPADTLVATYEDAVVSTYTNQIQKLWDQANAMGTDEESVTQALALLREAQGYLLIVRENYSLESSLLRMQETSIDSGIQFRQLQLETIEQNKSAAERSLARQTAERQRNEIYGSNVAVLQNLLYECKQRKTVSDADLEKLKDALPALRSVDPVRYEKELPQMLASLAGCIKFLATDDPDRARQVKESVASMIDDTQAFSSLTIQDKDPCANRALVGNGKIGRICADKLVVGGKGPDLVVIPGSTQTGGKNYAITRTEIRVIDYNRYCEVSGCPPLPGATAYPVTRLTLQDARNYAAWLSAQTDRNYRLPGLKEWVHAASTDKKESLDDNINCTVVSRGVKRGENLVASLSGKPNGWGLYNYVGNAREWVLDGRNLLAVGGSHTDLKVDCRIDKSVEHSGEADAVTGFRLVRDI